MTTWLLIIIYVLNIIDYIQTIYATRIFGINVELNPIGRYLLANNSAWTMKLVGVPIILVLLGFIIKQDKRQKWSLYFLLIVFIITIINNYIMLGG